MAATPLGWPGWAARVKIITMFEWLSASLFGTLLMVLLPTAGFILLVISGRMLYARLSRPRTSPLPHVARSSVGLSLDELQQLVQAYYRSQGYDLVVSNEPGQPAEMVALKESRQILIRCLGGDAPLGSGPVEALARSRDQIKAQRAVLIAPVGFRSDARRRAVALGIELRDKTQIELMRNISERRST
jgi:hypothetical protein